MIIQTIITYTAITAAVVYVLFSIYKMLFEKQDEVHGGCSSNCGCDAVKMRKDLLKNRKA